MKHNFEQLTDEKKQRIINACIEEFAGKGYDQASTNKMVERARISKGLLFHYFGNKKELFLYLLDHCLDNYTAYFFDHVKEYNPDFFQRILDWAELKVALLAEIPVVYRFMAIAFIDPPASLRNEVEKRNRKLFTIAQRYLLQGIDFSKFRDDLDREKTIELVMLAFSGLEKKYVERCRSISDWGYASRHQALEEIRPYIELMRKAFYK